MKVAIELNQEEAQVLINLIDVAVKAKGLEATKSAVYFTDMIQAAFNKKAEEDKAPKLEKLDQE